MKKSFITSRPHLPQLTQILIADIHTTDWTIVLAGEVLYKIIRQFLTVAALFIVTLQ